MSSEEVGVTFGLDMAVPTWLPSRAFGAAT